MQTAKAFPQARTLQSKLNAFTSLQRGACALVATAFAFSSITATAEEIRQDYDLDDDGLIEISNVDDLARLSQRHPSATRGATLAGHNAGCPESGCIGFELTNDIDFDINGDGQLDDNEMNALPNPIPYFSGVLEGNGHSIRNLYLSGESVGLFAEMRSAFVRNLHFGGELTQVHGNEYVGVLASAAYNSLIDNCSVTGEITASSHSGGLIGQIHDGIITNSRVDITMLPSGSSLHVVGGLVGLAVSSQLIANSANVNLITGHRLGGLIGASSRTQIVASYSIGTVAGDERSQANSGLVGYSEISTIEGSYSAAVVSGTAVDLGGITWLQSYAASGAHETSGSYNEGPATVSLAQLSCPTAANDDTCADITLFYNWDQYQDQNGKPYWSFGDSETLPYLNTPLDFGHELSFIDNDNDSVIDMQDAFPTLAAAWADGDDDGFPDSWSDQCGASCRTNSGLTIDAFPDHAAAAVDSDADGLPDKWNDNCDQSCQQESGLLLDTAPYEPCGVAGMTNAFLLFLLLGPLAGRIMRRKENVAVIPPKR